MSKQQEIVRDHYAQVASDIAGLAGNSSACICAPASAGEAAGLYMEEILRRLPDKALAASRGCGDPVSVAALQPGETVLDLGSGGGIDAIIASVFVGEAGKVYGVDMTPEMIELARANAAEAGASNVEFLHGNIEDIPLPDASVDVVISNCVINFADDKPAVFAEACRALKAGGRFVVSDIVAFKPIPQAIEPQMRRITGCLNGMLSPAEYDEQLKVAGFSRCAVNPKTVYTFEALEPRCAKKGRTSLLEEVKQYPEASGATGSVIVIGWKE